MPQETDRRTRRTRIALRDALAREIEATGDLGQVTVTAVTDRADVTRRTFYSHYRDIADLVRSIEDETIAELRPLVARIAATTLDELDEALKAFAPCPGSEAALEYFVERKSYLPALLGYGGDPAFVRRLEDMVFEQAQERVAQGFIIEHAGPIIDYYLTFAISAEVGVLVHWLSTGMEQHVSTVARMMTALMFIRPGDLYGRPIGFDIPTRLPKGVSIPELIAARRELFHG